MDQQAFSRGFVASSDEKVPIITQRFVRLPPRTGIPFEGFEFARVKSRLPVAQYLMDFLGQCAQSSSVNVALIRAEWGEGKTDAYERYIHPETAKAGSLTYLVSTSTIALHLEKIRRTFPRGGTTAASFLAATFAALKDELRSRHQDNGNLPNYAEYSDPLEYVHAVLKKHLENTDGKLFLFVDEFEEILNHPNAIQRFALSGIKELINGQLGIVHSGGVFRGRFHLIVAVTPYAYGRMHDDRELLQIFGSFASRPSTIDLPQIDRDEAFRFVMDLVRYSYGGSLPEPLPFQSAGILNAMAAISQRNMRALVQLYVDVMTAAVQKNSVKIIDSDRFIDALAKKELAVFGELRPCIDGELLRRIEAALRSNQVWGEKCVALLRLLIGEYRPFGVEEIKTRLGLSRDADVHAVVDIVNQELGKLGIPRAIMRLNPPKRGVSPASILGEIAPAGEDILLVENRLAVNSFQDALVHMEFEKDGLFRKTIYLPYEQLDLKDLFDVGDSDASFLISKIGSHFEAAARQRHFIISQQLEEHIFPSPTWVLVDFIVQRSKRAELWREANKNFSERVWQLSELVIEVINCSSRVQIQRTGKAQAIYETQYSVTGSRTIPIRTHVGATTNVTQDDVRKAVEAMDSKGASMGILIHAGDIEDEARHLITSSPQLITLRVTRAQALQLLVLGLAREKNLEVRDSALDAKLRDISHELDFERLLDQWIVRLREDGLLIDGLTTRYGRSDKALANALTFNINHLGVSLTAKELFDLITELHSFTMYRQNTPFAPIDIETIEELEKYLEDLVTNGFLEKEQDKLSVMRTAVENRILKMLERRPLSMDVLRRRFVIFSSNNAILEQVYLPILGRKGLVSVGNEVALEDPEVVLQSTNEAFQKYDSRISTLKQARWGSYAVLSVSKEREDRVISVEDFDAYVRRIHASPKDEETKQSQQLLLQRCHLISSLLEHFDKTLAKNVDAALSKGESYVRQAGEKLGDVVGKVSLLIQEYNRYCKERKYRTDDVEELTALRELEGSMNAINDTAFSKDTVKTELDSLRRRLSRGKKPHFYFGYEPEEADYYNLKVKQLRDLFETFEAKATSVIGSVDQTENRIRDVQRVRTRDKGKVATYRIDKVYAVSFAFLKRIGEFHAVPIEAEPSTGLTLSMLSQFFDRVHETLNKFSGKIDQTVSILEEILNDEKSISASHGRLEKIAGWVTAFFDSEDNPSTEAKRLSQSVAEARNAHTAETTSSIAEIDKMKHIDQLIDIGRRTSRSLGDIAQELSPIENGFAELKTSCIDMLNEYFMRVSKLTHVLKAGGASVSAHFQELETIVSGTKSMIVNAFQSEPVPLTWSEMWQELYAFRDRLYTESKKILSELEFKLLYLLVSIAGKERWVVTQDLVRSFSQEQRLEYADVLKALHALVERGFLKEGITLAA